MKPELTDQNIVTSPLNGDDISQLERIEMLFFAYRDFISDPDRELAAYNFGRAHHRVLFFVNTNPGLTVAELLETLSITKQSLARVLKQLVKDGFIVQTEGIPDRRKRLLYPTTSGRELILRLSHPQSERIERALENLDESEREAVTSFLKAMRSA